MQLVQPVDYTPAQQKYIQAFEKSVLLISQTSNIIMGAKDVNSRHIIATDAYSRIIGLQHGIEVKGKLDSEMPCVGTAKYSPDYIQEDIALMERGNINECLTILNTHEYSDGIKARVFKKNIFFHSPSKSILGVIYHGYDVDLQSIFRMLPNYILLAENKQLPHSLVMPDGFDDEYKNILTDYEQEICYLLLLNWNYKEIAEFMKKTHPEKAHVSPDAVVKKKNYLCQKFKLSSTDLSELQQYLIQIGFHNNVPRSFYLPILGSIPSRFS
jgi:hypothetical protein